MAGNPAGVDEETVRQALRSVMDPELGDNVVDLGMIQRVEVRPDASVLVGVALTIAGCPLRDQLRLDVERRVGSLSGVKGVEVEMAPMDAQARERLMARARRTARERAPATGVPPNARVLAVGSGKGGVGKSSVTVNLAVALARRGLTVGLLDADIWGFSVPRLLGLAGPVEAREGKMLPRTMEVGPGQLHVLSMGFLAEEGRAIMWRGLLLHRAVQQFLEDARWDGVDYLLIDLPPGTGDVQMGLARTLPRTELVVVTTPPKAAQQVAARAADMARRGYLRVVGVIENMSAFTCEHGTTYDLFGSGGGAALAGELGVDLLGRIPLDPALAQAGDAGTPVAGGTGPLAEVFAELARVVAEEAAPLVEASGCSARLLEAVERAVGDGPSLADAAR